MLFILKQTYTLKTTQAGLEMNIMLRYASLGKNHAYSMKAGSYDGVLYIEHIDSTLVAISENFVKDDKCL